MPSMRLRMKDEFEEFGCDASEEMSEAPRGHVALSRHLESKQSATDEMSQNGCPHQNLDDLAATAGQMMKSKMGF